MPDHILESEKWIWLPQQNKLQKILGCVEPYWGLPDLLAEVNGFIEVDAHDSYLQAHPKEYYRQFKTWEQFWLAIVMLLKFKKRWNKSKWCLERSLSKGEIGMV